MNYTIQTMLDNAFNDVMYQWEMHMMPSKLKNLSSKYNKRAAKLGVRLIDALRDDKRFICMSDQKTQGWFIGPSDPVIAMFDNGGEDKFEMYERINAYFVNSLK